MVWLYQLVISPGAIAISKSSGVVDQAAWAGWEWCFAIMIVKSALVSACCIHLQVTCVNPEVGYFSCRCA